MGVDGSTGVVTAGGGGSVRRSDKVIRGKVMPCTSTAGSASSGVLFTDPLSDTFIALSNFKNIEQVLPRAEHCYASMCYPCMFCPAKRI